jgi:hypothetical protein
MMPVPDQIRDPEADVEKLSELGEQTVSEILGIVTTGIGGRGLTTADTNAEVSLHPNEFTTITLKFPEDPTLMFCRVLPFDQI